MKLTWLGHACFLLEEQGYRIVLDPYTGMAGYPPLQMSTHAVFCSHGHFDHNAVDCVTLLPEKKSPFTVREVETFHDDRRGALRGANTIRIFTAGGVSVAHLGDLGHQLTAEQLCAVGPVDAALVPGGRRLYPGRCRGQDGVRSAEAQVRGAYALSPRTLWPAGAGGWGGFPKALARRGCPPVVWPLL